MGRRYTIRWSLAAAALVLAHQVCSAESFTTVMPVSARILPAAQSPSFDRLVQYLSDRAEPTDAEAAWRALIATRKPVAAQLPELVIEVARASILRCELQRANRQRELQQLEQSSAALEQRLARTSEPERQAMLYADLERLRQATDEAAANLARAAEAEQQLIDDIFRIADALHQSGLQALAH